MNAAELAPGMRVRVAFRFPSDEGFARRGFQNAEGTVTDEATLPGDPRLCVRTDSGARILIEPRELVAVDASAAALRSEVGR